MKLYLHTGFTDALLDNGLQRRDTSVELHDPHGIEGMALSKYRGKATVFVSLLSLDTRRGIQQARTNSTPKNPNSGQPKVDTYVGNTTVLTHVTC